MVKQNLLTIATGISVDRDALRQLASHYHIRRVRLFGSAARGDMRPDSDIDLLVEFESGQASSMGEMVEIQDKFSDLLGGRNVDVATSAILKNPFRRRAIEKDLKDLYAT